MTTTTTSNILIPPTSSSSPGGYSVVVQGVGTAAAVARAQLAEEIILRNEEDGQSRVVAMLLSWRAGTSLELVFPRRRARSARSWRAAGCKSASGELSTPTERVLRDSEESRRQYHYDYPRALPPL